MNDLFTTDNKDTMAKAVQESTKTAKERLESPWAVPAFICAAVSVFFFPIILSPLGVIFGAIATGQKDKRGPIAVIASILGGISGMYIGAQIMLSRMKGY